MSKMDEIIVVSPREEVFNNEKNTFQGTLLVSADKKKVEEIMSAYENHAIHMRRGDAEENEEYKQLIPYGIVTSDDRDGELRVFVYERLTGGGEARLHNQLSIGVGGHMNELFTPERGFLETIKAEAERELTEELIFDSVQGEVSPSDYDTKILGFINDDSNEVGKVHLGVLYSIETNPNHAVAVREVDQLKGEWMTLTELEAVKDRLENWSKIALEAMKHA